MRLYCTAFLILALTQLNGVVAQETTPDITIPQGRQTIYISDKKVSLACVANGDPAPTYMWYRDGTIIVPDSITQVDSVNGNLTIPSFTSREEGKYQCGAKNTVNQQNNPVALSPVILVQEVSLGANWPVIPTETIVKTEGASANLLCTDVPESVPKAKFSWFLESTDGAKIQVEENSRIHVDDKGTLHFIYLETSDQTDVNLYKCAIYNTILDTIRLGSPKSVLVTPLASKPYIKPQLEYETKPAIFQRSQTAELECVYSGFPEPTVAWRKDGNDITASDKYAFEKDKRKLMISGLLENDEGMYTCVGTNSAGTVQISIFLDVTSGPIWEQGLSDQTVPAGRDAVFYCKSRAAHGEDPIPTPNWYINGNPIDIQNPPGNGKFQFSDGGKVLTVVGLQKPDDIQCFQCNVSNTIGYEFANGCLNIIEPIDISGPPAVQEIEKGDRVNLTVKATSDPGYTLRERWHFKNQTYENTLPPHVIYNSATQEAYIDTAGLTDTEFDEVIGIYYRELYNQYETHTVTIEVKRKGDGGALAAASFPWWWIVVVMLLLVLLIIIFLLCFCCKRKQDEGSYKVYATEVNAVYLDPDKDLEDHKFHNVARIEPDVDDETFTKKKRPASNAAYEFNDDEPDSMDEYRNRRDHSGKYNAGYFSDDAPYANAGRYKHQESQA